MRRNFRTPIPWWGILAAALVVAWVVFYLWYIIHINATCDGHVLKNMFDWPVCVR